MALWTPAQTDITGLASWYDASDGTSLTTSGGAVSQWNDKSGNANHVTQSTGSQQPTVSAAAQNSLDVLSFNSANIQCLDSGTLAGYSGNNVTIFFVGKPTNASQNAVIDCTDTFGTLNRTFRGVFESNQVRWRTGTGSSGYAYSSGATHVFSAVINTTGKISYQDGTLKLNAAATTASMAANRLRIGGFTNGTYAYPGTVAEIVIYAGTLADADRQKVEGYLAWKWGLQGQLDASHPYLSAAPTASSGGDVTGTLAATESGSDTAAISGTVASADVSGSLAASESGSDTASASGSVASSGSLSATEAGSDAASFAGSVTVSGTLAATETGSDTAAFAGSVEAAGSLAVTETGSDTAAGSGSITAAGTLAAVEAGSDTVSGTGSVVAAGSLTATESGADTASGAGSVEASGSLAATESGSDTAALSGAYSPPGASGVLAATETGQDTVAAAGTVESSGSLAAAEAGGDTAAAAGTVAASGSMAATESGADTAALSGAVTPPGVSGVLAATETGSDTASATGAVAISGSVAASETGSDTAAGSGSVTVSGSLAAAEPGADSASIAGSVGPGGAVGSLAATETGQDTAAFSGAVVPPVTPPSPNPVRLAGMALRVSLSGRSRNGVLVGQARRPVSIH